MRRLAAALLLLALAACDPATPPPATAPAAAPPGSGAPAEPVAEAPPSYVGADRCAPCHAEVVQRWRGSQHDRAMQEATDTTVLGDFDDVRFDRAGGFGPSWRFVRRDGRFFAKALDEASDEAADEAAASYEVLWTFGVEPLQQYLVQLPDGRLQALPIAWDTRAREAGGQRWFDLQPDEPAPPGDPLHWTALAYNANSQCAECHVTNLRKGYGPARDAFATTWSEPDVACEACHGPGSRHVAWAEGAGADAVAPAGNADRGLVSSAADAPPGRWVFAADAPIAHREPPVAQRRELEVCAACHARRGLLREGHVAGEPLLDTHRPALLDAGLYHADGQMIDEVYVYGSFLQSRMFAAGVTCSDCHDPHSLALHAEGNALCGSCHRAAVFDTTAHHHHEPGSPGARCVACHMPTRTYMQVDARREHAFRVPRPDLSVALGTPNACTDCHTQRDAAWAAAAVARWFPTGRSGAPHFANALQAGRTGAPGADRALAALAADAEAPPIVRATALSLLADPAAPGARDALHAALGADDPLLRLGALAAAERVAPPERLGLFAPLLRDPRLAVRAEAGNVLADVPASLWRPADRSALAAALADYRAAQETNAERPEAHLNLGVLHQRLGEPDAARREYEAALRLAPWFVPAYVNLADLERAAGRDAAGEALLRRALAVDPDNADVLHALGLLLIRRGDASGALDAFERAATRAPGVPRYAFVWAIALHDQGDTDRALAVLEAAAARHPGDRDLLLALATISRDAGRPEEALRWARALVVVFPDDPEAHALLASLAAPAR